MKQLNQISFWIVLLVCFAAFNCKAESLENAKSIVNKIENVQTNKTSEADGIVGTWEVSNDYYMAVYEIEKYQDKYIGKVHYYNDGKTEYEGKNTDDDYFLEGVVFEDGQYKGGKMYMPDGSYYNVIFTLNGDELSCKMTVEGHPYTEVWKRKNYE